LPLSAAIVGTFIVVPQDLWQWGAAVFLSLGLGGYQYAVMTRRHCSLVVFCQRQKWVDEKGDLGFLGPGVERSVPQREVIYVAI
jgi:hypothetical protein